jgi:hypothetical protein
MLVDRSQRLEVEVLCDFLKAWSVALPIDVALQIAQDLALALGQRHPDFLLGE